MNKKDKLGNDFRYAAMLFNGKSRRRILMNYHLGDILQHIRTEGPFGGGFICEIRLVSSNNGIARPRLTKTAIRNCMKQQAKSIFKSGLVFDSSWIGRSAHYMVLHSVKQAGKVLVQHCISEYQMENERNNVVNPQLARFNKTVPSRYVRAYALDLIDAWPRKPAKQ